MNGFAKHYRAFAIAGALMALALVWGIIGFPTPAKAQVNFGDINGDGITFGPASMMPGQSTRLSFTNSVFDINGARPKLVVIAIFDASNGALLASNKGKLLQPGQGDFLDYSHLGPGPRHVFGLVVIANQPAHVGTVASMQLLGGDGATLVEYGNYAR
jgi:hypothetical protein